MLASPTRRRERNKKVEGKRVECLATTPISRSNRPIFASPSSSNISCHFLLSAGTFPAFRFENRRKNDNSNKTGTAKGDVFNTGDAIKIYPDCVCDLPVVIRSPQTVPQHSIHPAGPVARSSYGTITTESKEMRKKSQSINSIRKEKILTLCRRRRASRFPANGPPLRIPRN